MLDLQAKLNRLRNTGHIHIHGDESISLTPKGWLATQNIDLKQVQLSDASKHRVFHSILEYEDRQPFSLEMLQNQMSWDELTMRFFAHECYTQELISAYDHRWGSDVADTTYHITASNRHKLEIELSA